MNIYLIGWIIIPVSLLLFIKSPLKLLYATVFFIPFTGTSVFELNLGTLDAQGIRVSMYLGFLYLFRYSISTLSSWKIGFPNRFFSMSLLFLLIGIVIISLAMPIIINGELDVLDGYSDLIYYAEEKPLYFQLQYLTQVLYFIFGCLITYIIAINNKQEIIRKLLKIYLISSLFVCTWGLFEIFCFYTGLPYPAFLFNQNSMNFSGTIVLNGIPRITSVALEPSILSQQLLTTIPLLFWAYFYKSYIFSKAVDFLALTLITVVLALSLSTSAYAGLAIIYLLITFNLFRKKTIKMWFLVLNIVIITAIFFSLPFIIEDIYNKLNSFSGVERLRAFSHGWEYFTKYPVLGIGWGVLPSLDLVINILTGSGILGLLIFILLFISIYFGLNQVKKYCMSIDKFCVTLVEGTLYSLSILIIVSQISGFIYHSLYFWFILGISMAVSNLKKQDIQDEHLITENL